MKKIIWDLPFKTMHYLESLTDELAELPAVKLITGIQTPEGGIEQANIFVKENAEQDMDSALVYLGAIIGNHSANYAAEMNANEEGRNMIGKINGLCDDIFEKIAKQSKMPVVMHEGITNTHVEVKEGVIHVMPSSDDLFKEAEKQEDLGVKVDAKDLFDEPLAPDEKIVEKTPEAIIEDLPKATKEEEEKVEEVIEEIVKIKEKAAVAPKTKRKDNAFVAKLRVILKNFQK